MKKLLLLLFCVSAFARVGWQGNNFSAGTVTGSGVKAVTILSDDQVIDVNGFSIVNVDSDDPNATQRSFIPDKGKTIGQTVRLVCNPTGGNSSLNNEALIPGGGQIKLATASWSCTQQDDAQKLFWDGTNWLDDGEINL